MFNFGLQFYLQLVYNTEFPSSVDSVSILMIVPDAVTKRLVSGLPDGG